MDSSQEIIKRKKPISVYLRKLTPLKQNVQNFDDHTTQKKFRSITVQGYSDFSQQNEQNGDSDQSTAFKQGSINEKDLILQKKSKISSQTIKKWKSPKSQIKEVKEQANNNQKDSPQILNKIVLISQFILLQVFKQHNDSFIQNTVDQKLEQKNLPSLKSYLKSQQSQYENESSSPTKSNSKLQSKSKVQRILNKFKLNSSNFDSSQKIIQIFQIYQNELFYSIERKELQNIIEIVSKIQECCVDLNQIRFFTVLTKFLGLYCRDLFDFNKAIFFFNQYRVISELCDFFQMKIESLLLISSICTKLQLYDQSISFLKKGLQFSWKTNNIESELEIYEQIGLNYFYLGNIQESQFYHQKFMRADIELNDSPLKIISLAIIDRNNDIKPIKALKEFNKLFLVKLSLPIKNKFESTINETINCDTIKNVKYNNCIVEQLINQIYQEPEFYKFDLEQPVYSRLRKLYNESHSQNQKDQSKERSINKHNSNMESEDFQLNFIEQERLRQGKELKKDKVPKFKSIFGTEKFNFDKYNKQSLIDQDDLFKYKIPLEKIIQKRMKQNEDLSQVYRQVKNNVSNMLRQNRQGSRQKVNINHMADSKIQSQKTRSSESGQLLKKYQKFFQTELESIK